MADERRINVRVEDDFFDRLDEKRFRSKLSFQGLLTDLLQGWLHGTIDVETKRGDLNLPVEVPDDVKPYVTEFARWLMEPSTSSKEREMKESFKRIFAPKQKGKKRA